MSSQRDIFTQLDSLIKQSSDDSDITAAQVLADWGAPSVSIAILEDGKISSHIFSTDGDDTDTLFQAASISKPVAAIAVMRYIEQEHLSLQDKIIDVVPEQIARHLTSDPRTAGIVRTITIEQILSHTSGLSVGGFYGYADKNNVPSTIDLLMGKGCTRPVKLMTLPGLGVMYSGGGVMLLQLMLEHRLQKSFPQIMDEYVFKPLGMTRSFYEFPADETNIARCFWTKHHPSKPERWEQPEFAAAGLYTTATDLCKVARGMHDSLRGKSGAILKQATARQMLTVVKGFRGLGWTASYDLFEHGGDSFPGWQTYLHAYADLPWNKELVKENDDPKSAVRIPDGCAISIMTNGADGMHVYTKVLNAITYLKRWPQADTPTRGYSSLTPFRAPASTRVLTSWKEWLGKTWSDVWELVEDIDGMPAARIVGSDAIVALKPAAIPAVYFGMGKESIDLVFDGLHLMLRLGWNGDERVILLWNGGYRAPERTILRGW